MPEVSAELCSRCAGRDMTQPKIDSERPIGSIESLGHLRSGGDP